MPAEGNIGTLPLIVIAEPRLPGIFAITKTASKIKIARVHGITIE